MSKSGEAFHKVLLLGPAFWLTDMKIETDLKTSGYLSRAALISPWETKKCEGGSAPDTTKKQMLLEGHSLFQIQNSHQLLEFELAF